MTPRKRKVNAVSTAEPSGEPPSKRPRSQSPFDTANRQTRTFRSSDKSVKVSTDNAATKLSSTKTAHGEENDAAPLTELPQTWDQASAADKLLVELKEKNKKMTWDNIEQRWEEGTGKKAAKGVLYARHKQLKAIKAREREVKQGKEEFEVFEEPEEPLEAASRPVETSSAAPDDETAHEQDLPQSWEQADPGDQLIVKMRTRRMGWPRVYEAWQKLTGKQPEEGALQDRYELIKGLVILPTPTKRRFNRSQPVKASASSKRKAKAEPEAEEVSSDESSDQSYDQFSGQHLDDLPKSSTKMARQKPSGTVGDHSRISAPDGPSDERVAKPMKVMAQEPEDGRAEGGSSEESDKTSKRSRATVKSTKGPRTQIAIAAYPEAQNTTQTADEMLVEMKENGCSWDEISQAWTERTGLTHAPSTLRKRYPLIKNGTAKEVIHKVTRKRNISAATSDERSYDLSTKRSKSTTETLPAAEIPIKRNMDRGKRKSSVKYTDSTTDEDELYAAPDEPAATVPTPSKRRAARAAKVDRSDPEWLVTNEKSPLVDEDLHAEFSNPRTYENFTKSDWEDLRETLPSNVPVNPDGYSIPMTFFKYDPDFRRGIREFQEDLGSGRLDPKWQADAAQAMEDRARGEFDEYKENKFEEFWGQKQKTNHDALAGESTKIKFDLLIKNEIFKVGDYFSYSRVFGRGKTGVLIEKDCKVSQALDLCLFLWLTFYRSSSLTVKP